MDQNTQDGPEQHLGVREATEVGTTHLGTPGPLVAPWWVVPPSGHPQVPLYPIGGLLVHKKTTKISWCLDSV